MRSKFSIPATGDVGRLTFPSPSAGTGVGTYTPRESGASALIQCLLTLSCALGFQSNRRSALGCAPPTARRGPDISFAAFPELIWRALGARLSSRYLSRAMVGGPHAPRGGRG